VTGPGAPTLRETQDLVWRLLVAPEGVVRGVAALREQGALEGDDLSFLVRSDDRLGAVERLDIYADMYFYRLSDCLAEDFPKLKALLGAVRFHNLVTDYLLAHPPAHFSLRELGRALPDWLDSHPLSRELEAIADLARLEWARVDVFDESDAAPLSRSELLERAAADPAAFRFGLAPATRLLRVAAAVLPVWKGLEEGGSPEPGACRTRGGLQAVMVWRKDLAILHRSLAADEAHCLEALGEGPLDVARLGELLLEAQPPGGKPDGLPERLAGLLERWSRDAILTAPRR
jgi:hypothetical protein